MTNLIEIGASVLSFAGGVVLSIDALMVKKRIRTKAGADSLRTALSQISVPVRDENGKLLVSSQDWESWLAERSSRYAWIGFVLMAMGFSMDLVSKIFLGS